MAAAGLRAVGQQGPAHCGLADRRCAGPGEEKLAVMAGGAQAPGTGSRQQAQAQAQAGVMVEDGREERGGVSDEGQKRKNRTSLAADPVFGVLVGVRGFEPPASTSRT